MDGSVVNKFNNHGDHKSPKDWVVGPAMKMAEINADDPN